MPTEKQEAVQKSLRHGGGARFFVLSAGAGLPVGCAGPPTIFLAVQWAYLFERFPSFTQTFCYREVAEMERQGMAPWVYAIRRPQDEPAQDFPAGLAERVRYLPEEGELGEEFRWLKRCDRLPEPLRADEQRLKGGRDKARVQEAGWLGGRMKLAGIGHVHAHFAGIAARTAYWLRRHYGIGYSFTAHANDVFCPPDPDLSLTLAELVGAARFVVTVSDFGAAQLRERFPAAAAKIVRVYNGIDVEAFPVARPAANGARIVAVGRYIEKKGFDDLVAACALLAGRGVEFECRIVGEGPLEAELQAAIDRAGLRERVILTGLKPLAEVAALLKTARVFALPCVVEADGGMDNLPTVIAEAMAAGLPVVSTALAGVPEMVVDGQTGLLVPPRSPERLAGALARMLAEPVTAEAFGQEGRRRARKRFAAKNTARELKGLLLERTEIDPPRGTWWREPTLAWQVWQARRGQTGTGSA